MSEVSDYQTISCLIVDDEPMALQLLESYVLKTPFLTLKAKCSSAIEALQYLNKEPIQVLFLDIQMPDLTGLELSKIVDKKTKIIFTTAFDQYAIEGYKVDALDYLLKPFNYSEFLTAANKALSRFSIEQGSPHVDFKKTEDKEYIFVKSEYKQLRIILNDILFIEGLKDYIKIWMANNSKPILTLMSLKSLESELPKQSFLRVHRSFIVNLNKIEAIERSQIIIDKKRITVSEQYKPDFQNYIIKNTL